MRMLAAVTLMIATLTVAQAEARAGACNRYTGNKAALCQRMVNMRCNRYRGRTYDLCAQRIARQISRLSAGGSRQTCASVARKRQAACRAEARKRCRSSSSNLRSQCIDALVKVKYGPCTAPAVVTACQAIRKAHYRLCRRANEFPRAGVDAWVARANRIPGLLKRIGAFRRAHGKCLKKANWRRKGGYFRQFGGSTSTRIVGCSLTRRDLKQCAGAMATLKTRWGSFIGDKIGRELTSSLSMMRRYLAQPSSLQLCARRGKSLAASMQTIVKANARLPKSVRARGRALRSAVASLSKAGHACEVKYRALVAKRRCPRGKGRSRAFSRRVKRWYNKASPGDSFKKRARKVRLNGRRRTKYNAFTRQTFQYQPLIACVKQIYPTKTVCRIFTLTWRRVKSGRRRWSKWSHYSIGGGAEMNCKFLR